MGRGMKLINLHYSEVGFIEKKNGKEDFYSMSIRVKKASPINRGLLITEPDTSETWGNIQNMGT